jgi:hypothetical protein
MYVFIYKFLYQFDYNWNICKGDDSNNINNIKILNLIKESNM